MEEQQKYLETMGVANLREVSELAAKLATPWFKRHVVDLEKESGVGADWHKRYSGFSEPGLTEQKAIGF